MRSLSRWAAYVAVAALLMAASAWSFAAPNVWLDPSFERTGVPGVARTGEKAGHLAVAARNHWSAIGERIEVEPFARYRVTEWVKADVGQGTFFAPYCYEWDNYEWQFVSARAIQTLKDWTQTEVTFISPHPTMYVHPLAYIEAENCEGWVDDVVVEKIAEPEAAMAELAAKADRTPPETDLLARWQVQHGRPAEAVKLMKASDGLVHADIATALAQSTPGVRARRPFVVEVVAFGGPTFHEGVARFSEITKGMTEADELSICADAVKMRPEPVAARSLRLVVENLLASPGGLATVDEQSTRLNLVREPLRAALAAVPPDSGAAQELKGAMESVDEAAGQTQARKASLGHCVVRIGGKALAPETHAIVVPSRATPQENHAAQELRYHLELVTGRVFPIRSEKDAGKAIALYVGKCARAKALAPSIDFAGLGLEGIYVKTVGPSVILAGNQRGVLYATYSFLEEYLGCRWFTPDCSTWPKEGTIAVPALDRRTIPPLEYRAGDYPVSRPGDFAARSCFNGSGHWLDEEHGGKVGVHSLAHTFAALVPPERYYQDHPEYFSLVNGKRQSGYAQLCLTNPDVLRLCIEGVRRWIKENPQCTVFSVSQNDTGLWCQCDKCRTVAEEEGSQSGPIIRFVNAIADDIKTDYPNIAIETLAYQYSRKPPKLVKPRPNVIVCLCSIECCFIHPLATDPFNRSFTEDIKGWSRICKRLWIWDYIINYAHSICPFPNLYVLKPNISFFIENGVRGIYEESCYYTKGSEMQELRDYIIAKTLWDPTYDTDKAIDEFCAAYWGPAGKYVRQYLNLIHSSTQKDPNLHVQIYTHPRQYVFPEVIAEADKLFDQAEQAVPNDPVLLHRVQVARLPMMYAEIALAGSGAFAERGDRLVAAGGTDVSGLADRFEKIGRAEGLTMIREGGPDAGLDAWLKAIPRRPREIGIERLQNPALQLAVLPEVGGRIWRLKLLAGDRDLLKLNGKPEAWDPTDGGYEEYSEGAYRSPGWNEAYVVKEKSERGITLEATLSNGLRLTRRLELDPKKPLVRITSTLTNTTNGEHSACLRAHPEFAVTSTTDTSVLVQRADGTWKRQSLANPPDPLAEKDTWLRGEDVPAGAWAVVDRAADLAIVSRVPREQIGQCLLNWSGRGARVNLEVYSREGKLAPGASITLEQTYEVVQPAGKVIAP